MAYLISKPTRRELRERQQESLAKAGLSPQRYRGTARTIEEAHDLQRRLEREGEKFDRLWAVDPASSEGRQADRDFKVRAGLNPDTGELLNR